MADPPPHPINGDRLTTIYSVDPANEAALKKLESNAAPNVAADGSNGSSSSDLEASREEPKVQEEPPKRSTLKISLIMLSLCVRCRTFKAQKNLTNGLRRLRSFLLLLTP